MRSRARLPAWLAVVATGVTLLLSYAIKAQCLTHGWIDNFQYKRLCYNDLQPLFGVRGIADSLIPYVDVIYEYPVLTGAFMGGVGWLLRSLASAGLLDFSNEDYFRLSALLLAPFAFATTLLVRRDAPDRRMLIWAIGSPLLLYAFHNWDLIAVAGAALGLFLFARGRFAWSGAALAAAASAKLYPLFFVPALFLHLISRRNKRAASGFCLAFAGLLLAINVPVLIASSGTPPYLSRPDVLALSGDVSLRPPSTNGWLLIWTFHADRYPDFGTVWFWIAEHGKRIVSWQGWEVGQSGYQDFVSIFSLFLFAAGTALFLWRGWVRRHEIGDYPYIDISLGIVCMFLLFSKVHSPQYSLWVAPLLVLANIRLRYVLAYFAADAALFVSGFYYFTVMNSPSPAWFGIFEVTVWLRAIALALLAIQAWKAGATPGNASARSAPEGRLQRQ